MIGQDIHNLRKKIFHNFKRKAYSYEEIVSRDIKSYLREQSIQASRPYKYSNFDELVDRFLNSQVVFLGDFHTFDQNVRNVLRLLKILVEKKKPAVLAMEMINREDQLYIDAYLDRHITDLEFLDSINYHESWRFPWTHYKIIFELARDHKIKIVGINTTGSLRERDSFAGKACADILNLYPKSKLVVLYGELHITRTKIPAQLHKMNPDVKTLIIHQNLDDVYWRLVGEKKKYDVVKFSKDEFCLNSAPPWIKYESMVYWYENLCQDPEFDIHNYLIENGKKIFNEDTHEDFHSLLGQILKAVQLKIDFNELDDFNLYDHTNLELVQDKILDLDHRNLVNFYLHLVETGQSFRLPNANDYYCSNYSMNRLAYIVGINIYYFKLSSSNSSPLEILTEGSQTERYILFLYEAMLGYFFSKVINPYRKCDMYKNLKKRANDKKISAIELTTLTLAMETIDNKDLKIATRRKKLDKLHAAAILAGHILGEYLYFRIIEKNKKNLLEEILENLEISEKSFKSLRKILLEDIQYKNHIKRFF